jgi:hypothetical protein
VDDQACPAGEGVRQIRFDNGNLAAAVFEDGTSRRTLLSRLGLLATGSRPVVVVSGGAATLAGAELERTRAVLGPAVVGAARLTGAAVVDGGTAAGVMAVLGAARARQRAALPLVGVAPAGTITYPGGPVGDELVPLEPSHTHFVLANGAEWGAETGLLLDVAETLAAGGPVVVVLAGGGEVAKAETVGAVRRGWPVFVLAKTGGQANTIAKLWKAHRKPRRRLAALLPARHPRPSANSDLDLREIVGSDAVRLVPDDEPDPLTRRLAWALQDEPVLKRAWQSFTTYDQLAIRLQRTYKRFQGAILLLGIAATLLALLYQQLSNRVLHWAVITVPILVSVLIALANRRAAGKRWVLLRAAAEATKTEIYRYRTRTGGYADVPPDVPPAVTGAAAPTLPATTASAHSTGTRQQRLARQLQAIDARLMHTEASSGPLTPYSGSLPPENGAAATDDGLSPLDGSRYLEARVGDQLNYYHGKIRKLDRDRNALQLAAILSSAAGTVLAVAGVEVWIGLATTMSAAAAAYLANFQHDDTIVSYNQSAGTLSDLVNDWNAREPGDRNQAAFEDLVTRGEAVLVGELSGWVQQMNDAMQQLQESHAKPDGGRPPGQAPESLQAAEPPQAPEPPGRIPEPPQAGEPRKPE